MSDTKVKELPEAQSVGANDLLYLVANDTDYKVKGSTVKSFVKPAVMSGATSIAPGSEGLVPAPAVGDNTKYFSGDGTYKQPALSEMSDDATHRVVTDDEKGAWSNKQDALEFDDEPTDGSNNPVKSKGIYDALSEKANSADLATVATTGNYEDLTNTPTVPVIEANPSGEATAEMQKLQIDSTIYKFASQKAYGEITNVDIASFSDGADEPLTKLEVGIEAVQSGSGEPSPENVRPISGWDEVNVPRCGKNLLAKPIDNFTIDASVANCFFVKAGTYNISYTISESHRLGVRMMDKDGNLYTSNDVRPRDTFTYNSSAKAYYAGSDISSGNVSLTINVLMDCYIRLVTNKTSTSFSNAMLELGSTATTYEPYNGTTYPIQLGDTYYGGELDVTTGVLTINTLTKTIDGVNEQVGGVWGATTYGYAVYVNMPVNKTANTICDKFEYTNKGYVNMELYTYVGGSGTQQTWTFILPNTVTSKAEANDWFSNNPTTLTYPLDSPITVQLTPTQVKSLLKDNNIWADSGQIKDVVYVRDLNTYLKSLDDRITALENA